MPIAKPKQRDWRDALRRAQSPAPCHVTKLPVQCVDPITKMVQVLALLLILAAIELLLFVLPIPLGRPLQILRIAVGNRDGGKNIARR